MLRTLCPLKATNFRTLESGILKFSIVVLVYHCTKDSLQQPQMGVGVQNSTIVIRVIEVRGLMSAPCTPAPES